LMGVFRDNPQVLDIIKKEVTKLWQMEIQMQLSL